MFRLQQESSFSKNKKTGWRPYNEQACPVSFTVSFLATTSLGSWETVLCGKERRCQQILQLSI